MAIFILARAYLFDVTIRADRRKLERVSLISPRAGILETLDVECESFVGMPTIPTIAA